MNAFFGGFKMIKRIKNYFTPFEIALWCSSVLLITVSFFAFKSMSVCVFVASLIGVTSLIFNAKGNPVGQALMIIFALFYGYISYGFRYYGEMITYLGMSLPMAVLSLVSWLKNPYEGKKSEVKVNRIKSSEVVFMFALSAVVTVIFYFILKHFNTANLIPSTISVTTSFIAVYLTFRRSAWFALAYALNDAVLIVLWVLASLHNRSYIGVVICFTIFLVNDLYSFFSWLKREKMQRN